MKNNPYIAFWSAIVCSSVWVSSGHTNGQTFAIAWLVFAVAIVAAEVVSTQRSVGMDDNCDEIGMINRIVGKFIENAIHLFGGVTKREMNERIEEKRSAYEEWAVDNLKGKVGVTVTDCRIYAPFDGDDVVLIRSGTSIRGGRIKSLKIAPWCKSVSVIGCQYID